MLLKFIFSKQSLPLFWGKKKRKNTLYFNATKAQKMGFSKESKEIRHLLPQAPLKIVAFIFRSASVPAGERLAERIPSGFHNPGVM